MKKREVGLKHPVLNNVEYISITKNKKSVFESNDGKYFEGMTWRNFQLFLGERLTPSRYYFNIKFKGDNKLFSGTIKAVTLEAKQDHEMESEKILSEFKELKTVLQKGINQGGISYDMLLSSVKQGYENQINYLNQVIADKNILLAKNEKEILELESDLEDCQNESTKESRLSQYIDLATKFLASKYPTNKVATLKESDQTDIPGEILEILGAVDYSKIDDASMQKIIAGLKQYITFLPLKGQ